MSFANQRQAQEWNPPTDGTYPIGADVEYRLLERQRVVSAGTGRTKTISSSCVVFESERTLPVGLLVELAVTWPVRLDNRVGLKLKILGRTVRVAGNCTAVDILRHEFRTQPLRTFSERAGAQSSPLPDRSSTACAS